MASALCTFFIPSFFFSVYNQPISNFNSCCNELLKASIKLFDHLRCQTIELHWYLKIQWFLQSKSINNDESLVYHSTNLMFSFFVCANQQQHKITILGFAISSSLLLHALLLLHLCISSWQCSSHTNTIIFLSYILIHDFITIHKLFSTFNS